MRQKNYIGSAAHTLPEVQWQPGVYPSGVRRRRKRKKKKGPQMIFLFCSKQATILHDLFDMPETIFYWDLLVSKRSELDRLCLREQKPGQFRIV